MLVFKSLTKMLVHYTFNPFRLMEFSINFHHLRRLDKYIELDSNVRPQTNNVYISQLRVDRRVANADNFRYRSGPKLLLNSGFSGEFTNHVKLSIKNDIGQPGHTLYSVSLCIEMWKENFTNLLIPYLQWFTSYTIENR